MAVVLCNAAVRRNLAGSFNGVHPTISWGRSGLFIEYFVGLRCELPQSRREGGKAHIFGTQTRDRLSVKFAKAKAVDGIRDNFAYWQISLCSLIAPLIGVRWSRSDHTTSLMKWWSYTLFEFCGMTLIIFDRKTWKWLKVLSLIPAQFLTSLVP